MFEIYTPKVHTLRSDDNIHLPFTPLTIKILTKINYLRYNVQHCVLNRMCSTFEYSAE